MVKKYKIGRDAGTGKFIPVLQAKNRKKTAVVETMNRSSERKNKNNRLKVKKSKILR